MESKADLSKMSFTKDFVPQDLKVILNRGSVMVATFVGEFKNRKYFHIRELRENYGEWHPGKGIAVPLDLKKELLEALAHEYIQTSSREDRGALMTLIDNSFGSN